MAHRATGPISPEELQRIASLPYGKAQVELRKHDPSWGLATADNPNIKWQVTLVGTFYGTAVVEVDAPDRETAERLALDIDVPVRDWEIERYSAPEDVEADEITPAKP